MKILYVTTVSITLNTFFIPHIKHLLENGHEVEIASNIDVEIDSKYKDMGVKHNKIDFSRNPFSLSNKFAYKQVKDLQKRGKFEVVHVHTPVASFVTRLALRFENIKLIYTAHGFHFYDGAPILNWILYYPIEKIAARWTDTLVTINSEDLNRAKMFKLRKGGKVLLMHGVGIDKDEYNLYNFSREEYRKKLELDKDDFVILILAEINKNKNHIQMIKAIDLLKDKYPNIKLLCAGKGPLEEMLRVKVKELSLEKNIRFLGFRTDKKELLYSCDCVSLMSIREGLGKCLMEGMIAERVIVATNTRGPKELIEDNKSGFLVEVGDYKNTACKIEELYKSDSKRLEFISKSKKKVSKYYMDNVIDEIKYIY